MHYWLHVLAFDFGTPSFLFLSQGVENIAWDASGERLAVSYKNGNELYNGLIAIYDTRKAPLVSASLVLELLTHCKNTVSFRGYFISKAESYCMQII